MSVPGAGVARIEDGYAVAHELEEVLVAGDDGHPKPGGAGLHGQCPDDVVGLERLVRQHRHAECRASLVHVRHLLAQVGRHGRAIRLVVGGELVPEGRSPDVEGGGDERRPLVRDQLSEHRDEAIDRVRRPPVRCAQSAYRVIRAIHLGAAVDEEDGVGGVHRAVGVYPYGVAM